MRTRACMVVAVGGGPSDLSSTRTTAAAKSLPPSQENKRGSLCRGGRSSTESPVTTTKCRGVRNLEKPQARSPFSQGKIIPLKLAGSSFTGC